ncbi:MAG TPA: hypothetical protein EYP14_18815, partial [Planctomycetaceae bacterium]|nr:hypothetical protein [Planctomycetaceae bacterium]
MKSGHGHSGTSGPSIERRTGFPPEGGHEPHGPSLRRLGRGLMTLVVAGLLVGAIGSSVVFVDETQYVIIERLGHIVAVYDRPEDRGLHWKLAWPLSTARRFDRRARLFDPPGRELFTRDKKNITISRAVPRIAPRVSRSQQLLACPKTSFPGQRWLKAALHDRPRQAAHRNTVGVNNVRQVSSNASLQSL